eukprot:TRINITY_DN7289_c0_g1_i1.p1 TRINITY_DN7289_c0_g1~~TRINITY_DN7289_c0_g1_i1.p1  ORF type:complete len:727 (-),score=149.44 TRINITY_DN7289_c0_g1_i1:708-2888(-)
MEMDDGERSFQRRSSLSANSQKRELSIAQVVMSVMDKITNPLKWGQDSEPEELDESASWTEIVHTEMEDVENINSQGDTNTPKASHNNPVLQDRQLSIDVIPQYRRLAGECASSSQPNTPATEVQPGIYRDEYGFPLDSHEAALREKALEADARRIQKQRVAWRQYIQEVNFDSSNITKTDYLRKLVRFGIPAELRGQLWQALSSVREHRSRFPIMYKDIWDAFQDEELSHASQIERDLERTFPGHRVLNSPELIGFLRRILWSYAWVKPDVGYCQSMNFIVATLLLFMSEEESFWMLGHLIEDILPHDFYASNLFGALVENRVLHHLIQQKLPKIHGHLQELDVSIQPLTMQWIMCLFLNTLPFETCMRIWDILFYDGSKILFRISLGILKTLEKKILACNNAMEVMNVLKEEPRKLFDVEELFKTCWSKIWCGSMSSNMINALRTSYEVIVEEELHDLAERRRQYQEMKQQRERASFQAEASTDSVGDENKETTSHTSLLGSLATDKEKALEQGTYPQPHNLSIEVESKAVSEISSPANNRHGQEIIVLDGLSPSSSMLHAPHDDAEFRTYVTPDIFETKGWVIFEDHPEPVSSPNHGSNAADPEKRTSRANLIGIFQHGTPRVSDVSSPKPIHPGKDLSFIREISESGSEESEDGGSDNSPNRIVATKQRRPHYNSGQKDRFIEAHLQVQQDLHRQGFQQVLKRPIPCSKSLIHPLMDVYVDE